MKNKLKMLFSYFRGLKKETLETSIFFDSYMNIIDWDETFSLNFKLAGTFKDIILEIIEKLKSKISKYNDYDYSDDWYLNIKIYPFENKMIFTSECKLEFERKKREVSNLETYILKPQTNNYLEDIFEDNIIKKIEFHFYGRWDDGEVFEVFVNDIKTRLDNEDEYWFIVNDIMRNYLGQWWNSENGFRGDITIFSNGKLIIDGFEFYEDYDKTNMNIVITDESFDDEL